MFGGDCSATGIPYPDQTLSPVALALEVTELHHVRIVGYSSGRSRVAASNVIPGSCNRSDGTAGSVGNDQN
jgi:hypothetical protein